MNMPTDCEAVCNIVAPIMMIAPIKIAERRPRPSEIYGENGYAARLPMFYEDRQFPSLCSTSNTEVMHT